MLLTDFEGKFPSFFMPLAGQAGYKPFRLSRREPGVFTPIFKRTGGMRIEQASDGSI
jgi:hypothetical protein